MAKFCSSCGTSLDDAMNFCTSCGAKCVAAPQPAPQPVPQAPQRRLLYQPAPQPAYQPPPMQPSAVLTEKQKVLYEAPQALNLPGRPWQVTVEGDALVARWKWKDGMSFSAHEVTDDIRNYAFTVTLSDNRTWREADNTEDKSAKVGMSGGKISFGGSSNSFSGKTNQKSFSFGTNPQTGKAGMVRQFDTTQVKEPIRAYLTSRGWKKAGLFG